MSNKTNYLFKCKTTEAHIIKILVELLHNLLKTACFEIGPDGIRLRMMDSNRHTLIDVNLHASKFNMYYFNPGIENNVLNVGLNLYHLHKLIKCIKKRDQIIFFIEEDKPYDFGIEIIPKECLRITTSFIKIQNIQNLEIELPDHPTKGVLVSSPEFSKTCKDLFNMSNSIYILNRTFSILLFSHMGSIYSKYIVLGEKNQDDDKYNDEDAEEFNTEQLLRIFKVSGLSSTMNICCKKEFPLKIETSIGNIGYIHIFMKSKKQLENEQNI